MRDAKRKRFESTLTVLERRWGPRVLMPARQAQQRPVGIPTGFAALDDALGIGGIPLGAMTLLSGRTTSGKLTLAYKLLSHAQRPSISARGLTNMQTSAVSETAEVCDCPRSPQHHLVAVLDLNQSSDPDYLARCGVALDHVLMARPQSARQTRAVLLDLVRSHQVRAILVDSLADLIADANHRRYLDEALPQVNLLLSHVECALIFLDEAYPLWRRWLSGHASNLMGYHAALHIELQRERWLEESGELRGYQAQARVIRNRWARSGQAVSIAIEFNGTVRARDTW